MLEGAGLNGNVANPNGLETIYACREHVVSVTETSVHQSRL